MLTVVRCTQAVVWIQVTGSHELLSAVEDQLCSVQGTLPIPRELLPILVVIANRSLPIHGMYYSRRSWACIQVMGAGHNASAARARLEMQGTGTAARVVRGVYAEAHHKMSSVAHLPFVHLGRRTANEEKPVVRRLEVSNVHLASVGCMGEVGGRAFQEVLLACSVL